MDLIARSGERRGIEQAIFYLCVLGRLCGEPDIRRKVIRHIDLVNRMPNCSESTIGQVNDFAGRLVAGLQASVQVPGNVISAKYVACITLPR